MVISVSKHTYLKLRDNQCLKIDNLAIPSLILLNERHDMSNDMIMV